MAHDPLIGIEVWAQEIESVHLEEAVREARAMAHPEHIGLRDEDRKEIKAYHTGINNLLILLQEKIK